MHHTPTEEQQAAVDAYLSGNNVVIEAGAGTGKTSALVFVAAAQPQRRGLYVAFNKSLQLEAQRRFAGLNVDVRTMHSLAYRDFGVPMRSRMNNQKRFMFWADKAKFLGVNEKYGFTSADGLQRYLTRETIVRMATDTVSAFCRSAATEITANLVPIADTLVVPDEEKGRLQQHVLEYAIRYWDDISRPNGDLLYTHDYYLKAWQLSDPQLPYDYIMNDEAQDSDPAMLAVLERQVGSQMIAVGDAEQAIYGWRGASNALDHFGGVRTQLTQSWRFGPAIAEEANEWLDRLDARLRLRGVEGAPSSVWKSDRQPEAILTRSNVGAIREVLESQQLGMTVGVAGEKAPRELKALAKAALDLQQKGSTSHRDLDMFDSWNDVVQFSQEDEGDELAMLVKIIDDYSAETVVSAMDATVAPDQAQQVVSTAHVAKGLEWFHVRISDDFYPPKKDDEGVQLPMAREYARLAYVASTRAQRHLDARGLDWAKTFTAGVAA